MSSRAKSPGFAVPDGHRTAERRSLAMHAAIADQLTPQQLAAARERVAQWAADSSVDPRWVDAWAQVLAAPLDEVVRQIRRDDAEMTQLRQSTPFAGVLPNQTRWRILREVH